MSEVYLDNVGRRFIQKNDGYYQEASNVKLNPKQMKQHIQQNGGKKFHREADCSELFVNNSRVREQIVGQRTAENEQKLREKAERIKDILY